MSEFMEATAFILKGCGVSLEIFAITAVLSLPLGILTALGKTSKNKILIAILGFYTWVFRGSPLLIQVFFVYFGLPTIGITLNAMTACLLYTSPSPRDGLLSR